MIRRLATAPLLMLLTCSGTDRPAGREFVSNEVTLTTEPLVQSASLDTFGFPERDVRQRIRVILEPSSKLTDVVDLTIFAGVRPGVTHEQANRILGDPVSEHEDECGGKWLEYKTTRGTVIVGCEHDISGFPPLSFYCSWRLYAEPDPDAPVVINASLAGYIEKAREAPESVRERTIIVHTADYSDYVSYVFESRNGSPYFEWHEGELKDQRAFCWGAD